jgi:uncharacterized protein
MKQLIFFTLLFTMHCCSLFSQSGPYKIVFDITTGDTATHQRVVRWTNGILEAHPDAKIEIVFYGKALDMVVKEKSTVSGDVMKLALDKKVIFAVCEHAMKVFKIEKNQLVDGTITVPDALLELVAKQAAGYGYIKVVN